MFNPNAPGGKQKLRIDASNAKDVTCDNCNSLFFEPIILLKRLTALTSPTGQEMLFPAQLFRCADCKHINKEFLEQ